MSQSEATAAARQRADGTLDLYVLLSRDLLSRLGEAGGDHCIQINLECRGQRQALLMLGCEMHELNPERLQKLTDATKRLPADTEFLGAVFLDRETRHMLYDQDLAPLLADLPAGYNSLHVVRGETMEEGLATIARLKHVPPRRDVGPLAESLRASAPGSMHDFLQQGLQTAAKIHEQTDKLMHQPLGHQSHAILLSLDKTVFIAVDRQQADVMNQGKHCVLSMFLTPTVAQHVVLMTHTSVTDKKEQSNVRQQINKGYPGSVEIYWVGLQDSAIKHLCGGGDIWLPKTGVQQHFGKYGVEQINVFGAENLCNFYGHLHEAELKTPVLARRIATARHFQQLALQHFGIS